MISAYPEYSSELVFSEDEADVESIKDAVRAIRNMRSEKNVPPSKRSMVYVVAEDENVRRAFEEMKNVAKGLCSASDIITMAEKQGIDKNAVSLVTKNASIYIPLSDLIDPEKEIERLKKEEERLKGELKRSRSMLSNEKFTSKAPKEKVEEEQNKLLMYEEMMKKVVEQLKELEG